MFSIVVLVAKFSNYLITELSIFNEMGEILAFAYVKNSLWGV